MHAQRKFAQGSNVNSPVITPIKELECEEHNRDVLPEPEEMIHVKRPNTEDFLTFLCFRGTSMLPPNLNFFNTASIISTQVQTEEPENTCPKNGPIIATSEIKRSPNERPFIAFGVRKRADPVVISRQMDRKRRHALTLQALRRKYQEQKMAKIRAITISKLSEKITSKNVVRTRSVTKNETMTKKNVPQKTKVKVVATRRITTRRTIKQPIRTNLNTKMCLRSFRGRYKHHELGIRMHKKKPVKKKVVKKEEANKDQSDKECVSEEFSSDDDEPLVKTTKIKPVQKNTRLLGAKMLPDISLRLRSHKNVQHSLRKPHNRYFASNIRTTSDMINRVLRSPKGHIRRIFRRQEKQPKCNVDGVKLGNKRITRVTKNIDKDEKSIDAKTNDTCEKQLSKNVVKKGNKDIVEKNDAPVKDVGSNKIIKSTSTNEKMKSSTGDQSRNDGTAKTNKVVNCEKQSKVSTKVATNEKLNLKKTNKTISFQRMMDNKVINRQNHKPLRFKSNMNLRNGVITKEKLKSIRERRISDREMKKVSGGKNKKKKQAVAPPKVMKRSKKVEVPKKIKTEPNKPDSVKIPSAKDESKCAAKTQKSDESKMNPRPSRKTKEAAAIYMEILGHKLSNEKEIDDDNISIDSFPELPNVRKMEQRENELKARAKTKSSDAKNSSSENVNNVGKKQVIVKEYVSNETSNEESVKCSETCKVEQKESVKTKSKIVEVKNAVVGDEKKFNEEKKTVECEAASSTNLCENAQKSNEVVNQINASNHEMVSTLNVTNSLKTVSNFNVTSKVAIVRNEVKVIECTKNENLPNLESNEFECKVQIIENENKILNESKEIIMKRKSILCNKQHTSNNIESERKKQKVEQEENHSLNSVHIKSLRSSKFFNIDKWNLKNQNCIQFIDGVPSNINDAPVDFENEKKEHKFISLCLCGAKNELNVELLNSTVVATNNVIDTKLKLIPTNEFDSIVGVNKEGINNLSDDRNKRENIETTVDTKNAAEENFSDSDEEPLSTLKKCKQTETDVRTKQSTSTVVDVKDVVRCEEGLQRHLKPKRECTKNVQHYMPLFSSSDDEEKYFHGFVKMDPTERENIVNVDHTKCAAHSLLSSDLLCKDNRRSGKCKVNMSNEQIEKWLKDSAMAGVNAKNENDEMLKFDELVPDSIESHALKSPMERSEPLFVRDQARCVEESCNISVVSNSDTEKQLTKPIQNERKTIFRKEKGAPLKNVNAFSVSNESSVYAFEADIEDTVSTPFRRPSRRPSSTTTSKSEDDLSKLEEVLKNAGNCH